MPDIIRSRPNRVPQDIARREGGTRKGRAQEAALSRVH
jgi:hypothetical protein